jgi:hypothetical protein
LNNSIGFLIGLGLGLGIAAGVRPFLPALLAGGLAAGKVLGMRFVPGDYSFLQAGWWLIALAAVLLLAYLLQLRIGSVLFEAAAPAAALAGIGVGIGALLFAGSLSGHGDVSWPGLIGGGLAALLAQAFVRPMTARVRSRLNDKASREAVTLYLDVVALLIAALTALLHPLGYVAVALFAWLVFAGRRRTSGRYAGLRILGR